MRSASEQVEQGDPYTLENRQYGDTPGIYFFDGTEYRRLADRRIPPALAGSWSFGGIGTTTPTASGTFRADNSSWQTATAFRFNRFSQQLIDSREYLLFADVNDIIRFTAHDNIDFGGAYRLTEDPTEIAGGDVLFQNLTLIDGNGVIAGNASVSFIYE